MATKDKPNRFCQVCPRRLGKPPGEPCQLALERIHAIQALDQDGKKRKDFDNLPGCPWYVTSAEHGYCFWNMANDLEPMSDKEIADLLLMTQSHVDRTFKSAIEKLRAIKDTENMQELKETIMDMIAKQTDNTVYLPDKFNNLLETPSITEEAMEDDIEADIMKDEPKKKKKVHLYGLYSQRKLQEMKDAKKNNKK